MFTTYIPVQNMPAGGAVWSRQFSWTNLVLVCVLAAIAVYLYRIATGLDYLVEFLSSLVEASTFEDAVPLFAALGKAGNIASAALL